MAQLIQTNIRLQPAQTVLVEDQLTLLSGLKYALIGPNGAGKTTLMNYIHDYIEKHHHNRIRIGYIKQNISGLIQKEESVLEHLIAQDCYRMELLNQKQHIEKLLYEDGENEDSENNDDIDVEYYVEKLSEIEDELREIKAHSSQKRAQQILQGLGFDIHTQIKQLSGGWIMRLQLAKLLFLNLDLLLLDEPTNHLDLDAIEWLEEYLSNLDKKTTLIVISHDLTFLQRVCNRFLEINPKSKKLNLLKNFDLELSDELNKKKALFDFNDNIKYGYYNIQLHNVEFGYDKEVLFSEIDLCIDTESKIGILGPNGIGKSTLLKVIMNKLKPIKGEVKVSRKLSLFHLKQIFNSKDTLNLTAIEFIQQIDSKMKMKDIRNVLGKSGLKGSLHTQKIVNLSGGQKTRLMIANILIKKPHILLLDEPTNHLDLEGIQIFIKSLKSFNGGFIIVSHNRYLIYELCEDIYELKNKRLNEI